MAKAETDVRAITEKFLGKELYVVLSTPAASRDEIAPHMTDHLAHQVSIEKRGILFAAGPMFEKGAAAPARGMIVIRAGSFEEADEIAASDPLHKLGLRTYSIERWIINEGSYTATINYSDQSVSID